MPILDPYGKPIVSSRMASAQDQLKAAHFELRAVKSEIGRAIKARYDVDQTNDGNMRHWANADNLSPDAANSLTVRRRIRSRSRYEVIENNPYLKGTMLTLSNDFVGSGPAIQVIDDDYTKKQRSNIERDIQEWFEAINFRRKLWRMKMAKMIDGETFAVKYTDLELDNEVKLNLQLFECDQFSSNGVLASPSNTFNEIDGIRYDNHERVHFYHLLNRHPGSNAFIQMMSNTKTTGTWLPADLVIHWFRQDRGWLRGIPETVTSLPLCALLRRYTLAVVKAAELAAAFSAVLETNNPANTQQFDPDSDDPFDIFPIEHGMITTMPYGTKINQMKAEQPVTVYDKFVNALLREILRPLQVPFLLGAGSSQESNMSAAVVDTHFYKTGQTNERHDGEAQVVDPVFKAWWKEYALIKRLNVKRVPRHTSRWDLIGLDHTDPSKVANALSILHDKGFITDRDIQEGRFNRSYEDWQKDIKAQQDFRNLLGTLEQPPAKDPNAPTPASIGRNPNKPGNKAQKKAAGKSTKN